jgi:glutaminyl-peptide cyclotransferase
VAPNLLFVRAFLAVSVAVLVAAGVAVGAVVRGDSEPKGHPTAATGVDRFDADRAWALVELQLGHGQRPAGSPQLRKLASKLRHRMPGGHFEAIPGEPRLRNVVGTIPGRRPGLVIGAHYDTLVEPKGFVGANNGAAGSAIVVELGRTLARLKRPENAREIRLVLFDGEEPASGLPEKDPDFYANGLRGSKAYVKAHKDRTDAMVLLDYVGNKNLRLPREGSSTGQLWDQVRAAARTVGAARTFPDDTQTTLLDDHTPFLREGLPAVDLIDWSYPGHDVSDTIDKLSRRSLDAVGETMVELVRRLDRSG